MKRSGQALALADLARAHHPRKSVIVGILFLDKVVAIPIALTRRSYKQQGVYFRISLENFVNKCLPKAAGAASDKDSGI